MITHDIKPISGWNILLEVTEGQHNACNWAEQHKGFIEQQLANTGILLVRGLSIESGEEFSQMLTTFFGNELGSYVNRSTPRTEVHSKIYTASEYHPSETIPQHNENSYSHSWPVYISFLCREAASTGGNTPVSDSRIAYREIPREIRDEFERKNVMYVRNYNDLDLPWTEVFQTDNAGMVESYCREHDIQFEWTETGLRTRQVSQAVINHPAKGDRLWFNQAHLFHVSSLSEELQENLIDLLGEENLPRNAYFGDGTPIDLAYLSAIREVYDRTKFTFQWQQNDLLLLDNMLFTHGRQPFTGKRQVLVGMAKECHAAGFKQVQY